MERQIRDFCNEHNIEPYELISHIEQTEIWIQELKIFCDRYDFNPRYLCESINDPKVIPMIRGKAFEFSAKEALENVLPSEQYNVSNPRMNAQTGSHDIDVKIRDQHNNIDFSIECKLSGKGSFRVQKNGNAYTKVKCMRSRTLGPAEIARRTIGNENFAEMLSIHNDQYQAQDFDLVMTSLGNALFSTDVQDSTFFYDPKEDQQRYLLNSGVANQADCFSKMYVALATDLVVDESNHLNNNCTRGKCKTNGTSTNCKFIPNYPVIQFGKTLNTIQAPWVPIEEIEVLLERIRQSRAREV
jgi:hypothetical protein